MPIIWQHPDGSIQVMNLSSRYLAGHHQADETTAQAVLRLAQHQQTKNPDLTPATPVLVKSADMPSDYTKRHKWRLQGSRCVVDDTVPDPPHPRQSLLDQINAAATLDDVKQRMADLVRMRG